MPFARPTTTPTPDEIFDEWVHRLKHSELLVLLYIVRRTFGFRDRYGELKDGDTISLRQFHEGIVTRSGKRLDHGCGVRNKTSITAALKRLEELGLIRARRSESAEKGNETTWYSLAFAGDDADDDADEASGTHDGHSADGGDSSDSAPRPVERPLNVGGCADRIGGGTQIVPPGYEGRTPPGTQNAPGGVRTAHPQQTVETTNSRRQTGLSKRKAPTHHAAAPLDSTDSTASTGDLTSMTTTEEGRSPVGAAVADLSAEFGDDAPRASHTRVVNMQRAAGLDDADLLPLLDEAAAIARSQTTTITKRGRDGTIVRMPYLLATLRDLVDAPNVPDISLVNSGVARPDPRLAGADSGPVAASAPALVRPAPSGPGAPDVATTAATASVAGDDPPADGAAAAVWRAVLGEVREVLTPENYAVWFVPTRALILEGDVLRVVVPSPFHADWLAHKLRGRVQQALERTGHAGVRIAYDVAAGDSVASAGDGIMATLLPLSGCPSCRAAPCCCRHEEHKRQAIPRVVVTPPPPTQAVGL